ncbi:hypothetical protein C8Q72DRAFT_884785 [Fomitopsis betulina]|nr:hypothetical protein C8Q72DRAFT_884785 [Fomitopsis betulina]
MSLYPATRAASASSSQKLPVSADASIWTPAPAPIDLHLATKGRQDKFLESTAQRRQRVEFLRRREWTRRIAEWIDSAAAGSSSSSADAKALAPITYSWVDILAAADADDDYEDTPAFVPSAPTPSPSPHPHPSVTHPYTPDGQDDEPYIIYTASPRSRASTPAPTPAYPARPPALQPVRRRPGLSPRSRHSSLSSISEEVVPTSTTSF